MRKRNFTIAYVISFVFLSACTSVQIKDSEWCGDMGVVGAQCFHMKSKGERFLEKEAWDTERFGMVCTRSENFANFKSVILKLCHKTKMCSYEVIQTANSFTEKAESSVKKLRRSNVDE